MAIAGTDIDFGFVASAAGAPGVSDSETYQNILGDCEEYSALGYTTAWILEHHFSDYFPTPDPVALLHFIAARFPQLNLGTCVIVTPWYEPLRLAGAIAQLNTLADSELHLGLGRGAAKYEYDRFGRDMEESRPRFKETLDILRLALRGEPFTYEGKIFQITKETRVRPRTNAEKIHFYGAIGSPGSAEIMAELGIPPMCTTIGDYEAQKRTLDAWKEKARSKGVLTDVKFPIMVNCIIADTDEQAIEEAQLYMPRFMQAQVDHYTVDETDWENIKSYEAWKRIFSGLKSRCDPEKIPAWTKWQFVGTPETVRKRVQAYIDAGFNTFLIHTATPGVPIEPRRRWTRRFASEVAPHFSSSFEAGRQQQVSQVDG